MRVNGRHYRTIWLKADGASVEIIDQTLLPHRFATSTLSTLGDAAQAIRTMRVRGAPLIGAAAAYGLALAMRQDASDQALERACDALLKTRPTGINLRWALDDMRGHLRHRPPEQRIAAAYSRAAAICPWSDICRRQSSTRSNTRRSLWGSAMSSPARWCAAPITHGNTSRKQEFCPGVGLHRRLILRLWRSIY